MSNSLKHAFKNRTQGKIDLQVQADTQHCLIDYRDDGIGMTPDVLEHIFEPFFSTDLAHGMGLGLHLVYNLATQRLGGTIACTSQPEMGAHFHLEIPR